MMKRLISLILAACTLLACAGLLAGCSDKENGEFPVTVGGASVKSEPKRVVVLNDSFADIISCIGYDGKMVACAVTCDQFLDVVASVGTPDNPAVDTIVNCRADLVIADTTLSDKSRKKITEAGITIVTLESATDKESLLQLYLDLGTALGGKTAGKEKAKKAYDNLFSLLADLQTAASDIIQTAVYLYMDENGQLCTFVSGSLEQEIFDYNGLMNVFENQTTPAVDSAQLRMASPTYLFVDGTVNRKNEMIESDVLSYLNNDEKLSGLKALKDGNYCCIPYRYFFRQGVTFKNVVFDMIDYLKIEIKTEVATPDEVEPDLDDDETATEQGISADGHDEDDIGSDDYDDYDDYGDDEYYGE